MNPPVYASLYSNIQGRTTNNVCICYPVERIAPKGLHINSKVEHPFNIEPPSSGSLTPGNVNFIVYCFVFRQCYSLTY